MTNYHQPHEFDYLEDWQDKPLCICGGLKDDPIHVKSRVKPLVHSSTQQKPVTGISERASKKVKSHVKAAPKKVWLQIGEHQDDEERTWCEDKINESDVEYIRADQFPDEVKKADSDSLRKVTKEMKESDFDQWLKLHEINIWDHLTLEEKVEAIRDYLLKFIEPKEEVEVEGV